MGGARDWALSQMKTGRGDEKNDGAAKDVRTINPNKPAGNGGSAGRSIAMEQ